MFIERIDNNWGEWTLLWDKQGILSFGMEKIACPQSAVEKPLAGFAERLADYLHGKPTTWEWALQLQDATPFRQKVWQALRQIPYGETRTYQQIASLCGNPRAPRAVGQACSQNPIMIIIPCHRVIGKDGSLTGFAGGIDVKEKLLALERRQCQKGQ